MTIAVQQIEAYMNQFHNAFPSKPGLAENL